MDIKSLITEEDHSQEYLHSVDWLYEKIGQEDSEVQAAWVQQYSLLEDFTAELGGELYEYAHDHTIDYAMFHTMLWYNMEKVYVNVHGYSSDKIFSQ